MALVPVPVANVSTAIACSISVAARAVSRSASASAVTLLTAIAAAVALAAFAIAGGPNAIGLAGLPRFDHTSGAIVDCGKLCASRRGDLEGTGQADAGTLSRWCGKRG